MRFQICEFCKNWNFQYVNFWITCGFLPQCEKNRYLHVNTSVVFVASKHQHENQIGNEGNQGQNGQDTRLQNILPSQDPGVPDLLVVTGDVGDGNRPYLDLPHFGRQPRPVLSAKHPDGGKLDY